MDYVELSGVASVLAIGASLAVAGSLIALSAPRQGAAEYVLRYTGFVLLAVGMLGACLLVAGWLGLLAWPVVMFVWGRAAMHHRATQKRNLLSALAVAVDKQMPLAPMALAFANDEEQGFSARARELAETLEQGVPLTEAIAQSRRALPPESALAAAVGAESGDLAGALDATTYASVFDRTWLQPVISRLLYLFAVVALFFAVLVFIQVKITPSWVAIFGDFGLSPALPSFGVVDFPDPPLLAPFFDWLSFQLPPGTGLTVMAAPWVTGWLLLALLVLIVVGTYAWLEWRGTLYPRSPGLGPIVNWVDMGPVLRVLALATAHNRPLTGMFVAIARLHPKRSVRGRVRRVVRDLDDGRPWFDSLRRRGLVSSIDASILASAARSGNLTWALREMAGSYERRATYRLQALAETVVPLLLLPIGAATALIGIAYYSPLASLIESLA